MNERFESTSKQGQIISLEAIKQKRGVVRAAMVPLERVGDLDVEQTETYNNLKTYFSVLNLFFELAKNNTAVPETWEELGVSVTGEVAKIPVPPGEKERNPEATEIEAKTPQDFLQQIGASKISDIRNLINQRMPSRQQTVYRPQTASTPQEEATQIKSAEKPKYDPETDPYRNLGKSTPKPKRRWPFSS